MSFRHRTLIGLLGVACCLPAFAKEQPLNRLSHVEVRETAKATEIVVTGDHVPKFTVFKLSDPIRLFIDVTDADVSAIAEPIEVGNGTIDTIAAVTQGDDLVRIGRIMVELKVDAPYTVRTQGNQLVLAVNAAKRTARKPLKVSQPAPNRAGADPAALVAANARAQSAEVQAQASADESARLAQEAAEASQLAAAATLRAEAAEATHADLRDTIDRQAQVARQEITALEAQKAELAQALAQARAAQDAARTRQLEAEEQARVAALAVEQARVAQLESTRDRTEHDDKVNALQARLTQADPAEMEKLRGELDSLQADGRELRAKLERRSKQLEQALEQAAQSRKAADSLRARLADVNDTGETTRVSNIRFDDERDLSRIEVVFDGTPRYRIRREGDRTRVLELRNARIDRAIEQRLDTSAFSSPVRLVSSFQVPNQADVVHVAVTLAEGVPDNVQRQGNRLVWTFTKSGGVMGGVAANVDPQEVEYADTRAAVYAGLAQPAAPKRLTRGGTKSQTFTGRKINVDIKDGDIHNVLRLLAKEGNVNIVTSDSVSGTVTLHLKLVPWDQALDIVIKSKGLDMVRSGDIIRVAPREDIANERRLELEKLDQEKRLRPLEIRLVTVNHASAEDLLKRVESVMSNRGKVERDVRTNTLILNDTEEFLNAAEDMIRRLDTQTPQVLIEARIVEVNNVTAQQLGIQWGFDSIFSSATGNPTGLRFPSTVGIRGAADDTNAPSTGVSSTPNFAVNLPAAAGAGSGGAIGMTLGSIDGTFNLNVRLSAFHNIGTVKIVSAPKITTLDNKQAEISQGVSIPISQVSAAGVQTVFFDAVLSLRATPHVTQDGNIYLDLEVENNTPDFQNVGARGDPTILRKEAKTSLLLKDGDTTVIGGIYTSNTGYNRSEVPYLAAIPILGAIFRNAQESDRRTELLIFITPRIVNRAAATVQTVSN